MKSCSDLIALRLQGRTAEAKLLRVEADVAAMSAVRPNEDGGCVMSSTSRACYQLANIYQGLTMVKASAPAQDLQEKAGRITKISDFLRSAQSTFLTAQVSQYWTG